MQAAFRTILEAAGILVVGEAATGDEAVALVGTERPDVVIMDVRMPGGDGLSATGQISRDYPSTRVLVLTTFDLDDYLFGALDAGAAGFLLKNAAPEELIAAVGRRGRRRSSRSGDHRQGDNPIQSQPGPQQHPAGPGASRCPRIAHQPGARRPGPAGAGDVQRGDRRIADRRGRHREDTCLAAADQARGPRPSASSNPRLSERHHVRPFGGTGHDTSGQGGQAAIAGGQGPAGAISRSVQPMTGVGNVGPVARRGPASRAAAGSSEGNSQGAPLTRMCCAQCEPARTTPQSPCATRHPGAGHRLAKRHQ